MKKQLAIGLMSGVALLALAACGSNTSKSSSDKKIQLTMWQTFSDTETPVFNQIVKDYEKENPNVEIKAVRMPSGDDYNQQLVQAIGGNSAPDLARVEVTAVPKYAKLGALEKLDGYEGFSDIKKEVYPATMQSNLYNGSYYGIPLDTSTRIAIYNKSLLETAGVKEVPKDFDTLINDTKSLVNKNTTLFAPSGMSPWSLMPYFYSLGGVYTNKDYTKSTGYLDSEESIEALQKLVDWNKAGYFGKSMTGGLGTWEGLNGNNYLMIDEGSFYFPANTKMKDKVTYALFPEGKAGSIQVLGGENTVVFKSSKHKQAAYDFAKYLASDKVQTIFAKKLEMSPVNKLTAENSVVKDNPLMAMYSKQMETAQPRIPSPNWDNMDKVLTTAFEGALTGKMTAKQALTDAAEKMDQLLK